MPEWILYYKNTKIRTTKFELNLMDDEFCKICSIIVFIKGLRKLWSLYIWLFIFGYLFFLI